MKPQQRFVSSRGRPHHETHHGQAATRSSENNATADSRPLPEDPGRVVRDHTPAENWSASCAVDSSRSARGHFERCGHPDRRIIVRALIFNHQVPEGIAPTLRRQVKGQPAPQGTRASPTTSQSSSAARTGRGVPEGPRDTGRHHDPPMKTAESVTALTTAPRR